MKDEPVHPQGRNEIEEHRDEQLIDDISHELEIIENNRNNDENPDWDGSESELVADDDAEQEKEGDRMFHLFIIPFTVKHTLFACKITENFADECRFHII